MSPSSSNQWQNTILTLRGLCRSLRTLPQLTGAGRSQMISMSIRANGQQQRTKGPQHVRTLVCHRFDGLPKQCHREACLLPPWHTLDRTGSVVAAGNSPTTSKADIEEVHYAQKENKARTRKTLFYKPRTPYSRWYFHGQSKKWNWRGRELQLQASITDNPGLIARSYCLQVVQYTVPHAANTKCISMTESSIDSLATCHIWMSKGW